MMATAANMSGLLYVGTHRRGQKSDEADAAFGIYRMRETGGLLTADGMIETEQPGWIALHPRKTSAYAVNEVRSLDGHDGGAVTAFAMEPATGALCLLNRRQTPAMPCHCAVDETGRFLLVATFGGGSVHLFPIADDGSLGDELDAHRHEGGSIHPRRQTEPHAHAVAVAPGNRFVLVPDLGTDMVYVYALDCRAGRLVPLPEKSMPSPPGSGPRHVAFGKDGGFAYLINEMSATLTALAFDGDKGSLHPVQTVDLLPDGFTGFRSGAAVVVHPEGTFLYATTRSHGSSGMPAKPGLDQLVWFAINKATGLVNQGGAVFSGGQIPRSMTFDASGSRLFVGHQRSGTIVTFAIDQVNGRPIPSGPAAETPVPVCLVSIA